MKTISTRETNEQYSGFVSGSKEELIDVVTTLLKALRGSEQVFTAYVAGKEVMDQEEGVQEDFESAKVKLDELTVKYIKPYGTQ